MYKDILQFIIPYFIWQLNQISSQIIILLIVVCAWYFPVVEKGKDSHSGTMSFLWTKSTPMYQM